MHVLVLSYDRPNDLFYPGSPGCESLKKRFPGCTFRFKRNSEYTREDLAWAEVVTGHPDPAWLEGA
ncbi:hypothetical protein LJC32_03265, partial [Oscillospiraceae bacterium OttesenSCG-928-F05]|nr:hypothetical protein [Oscillospiraceae bacterium OttesenSCG-928-F05]